MAKIALFACVAGLFLGLATAQTTAAPGTTAAPTTAAPADTTAAPSDTTAAPSDTTAAPADTTAAPADTTAAPADRTPQPMAGGDTTAAPADTTAAPADTPQPMAGGDTTAAPATDAPTSAAPTEAPTTAAPTEAPTTAAATAGPTTTPPQAKGLYVTCTADEIQIKLDLREHTNLQFDSISLNDKDCEAYKTDKNYAYFRSGLDQCGTTHKTDDKTITYHNSIRAETTAKANSAKISRDFEAEFPISCTYDRSAIVSIVSFSPRKKVVYSTASGVGNFTYEMNLLEGDNAQTDEISTYPHEIDLNKYLNVRAQVKSNDSQLALFVEKCWATPNEDPDYKTQHVIIADGCKKDNTVLFDFKVNKPLQFFRFKSFRFRKVNSDNVHIHCMVEACRSGDKDSNCAKGCTSSRKRRSLASDASSTVLTIGSVKVVGEANAQTVSGNASSLTTVSVIAGVLALVIMGLVAALVVIYKKRQAQPNPRVVFKKVNPDENPLV